MTAQEYEWVQTLIQQRRLDAAEQRLRAGLQHNPNDANAHALLAWTYALRDDAPAATAAARAAVDLDPTNPAAFLALSKAMECAGRWTECEDAAAQALALNPADAETYAQIAGAQGSLRRYTEALATCDAGLQLEPQNLSCRRIRVHMLSKLHRAQDADQAARELLAIAPGSIEAHAAGGFVARQAGRHADARSHFQQALAHRADDPYVTDGLADSLLDAYRLLGFIPRYSLRSKNAAPTMLFGGALSLLFAFKSDPGHPEIALIAAFLLTALSFVFWSYDALWEFGLSLTRHAPLLSPNRRRAGRYGATLLCTLLLATVVAWTLHAPIPFFATLWITSVIGPKLVLPLRSIPGPNARRMWPVLILHILTWLGLLIWVAARNPGRSLLVKTTAVLHAAIGFAALARMFEFHKVTPHNPGPPPP